MASVRDWLTANPGGGQILVLHLSSPCAWQRHVQRDERGPEMEGGNCHVFPSNGPCMSGDPPFIPPSATQSVWREGGGEGEDGVWPGERMTTVEAPLRQTLFWRHT